MRLAWTSRATSCSAITTASCRATRWPTRVVQVPADPERQYVDHAQYRALHATGKQADAHGFGYIDPAEATASKGATDYYSFSPKPGFRFIAIDTVSEGGIPGPSADGNIDD